MIPASETLQKMNVWILVDDRVGHINQSLGVADALDISPEIIKLEPKKYGKVLGRINGKWAVKNSFSKPWPDMIIATGTLPALVSGWIKQQNPATITVQMMRPPNKLYLYDIIAIPFHAKIKQRNNVIQTIGTPNKISLKMLKEEKEKWQNEFSKMANPLAVLIGGSNKFFNFDEEYAKNFAENTVTFAIQNGFKSLLVTASRRTGDKQTKIIQDIFTESKLDIYFWNNEDNNPYFAFLAWAKAVLVTADSIGMVSESCTAGLPVCVYGIKNMHSKKFARFFKVLIAQKMIYPFSLDKIDFKAPNNPLSDTKKVAGAVSALVFKSSL